MQIIVPIFGLEENYYSQNLSNIQEILLYGLEKLDYVNYKRISFATFDHELMDPLHTVSDIFYQQKGVCIKANFEFNAITDPGLIHSQHVFASLGLGLITKLFSDYQKRYENPGVDSFELVCITGVLDKNPSSPSFQARSPKYQCKF